jgi:hypothetical protein
MTETKIEIYYTSRPDNRDTDTLAVSYFPLNESNNIG